MGYPISETSRLSFGLSAQQDKLKTGRYTVKEIFRGRRVKPSPTTRRLPAGHNPL